MIDQPGKTTNPGGPSRGQLLALAESLAASKTIPPLTRSHTRTGSAQKATDVKLVESKLYFLPVQTRLPLKFGPETLTHVTCARVCVKITDNRGRVAEGWGETPLSVQWVWPANTPYDDRHAALKQFCIGLGELWVSSGLWGHPVELGHEFQAGVLPGLLRDFNQRHRNGAEPLPYLAALVCFSPYDLALHDAYGKLHQKPSYDTYSSQFMNRDLAAYLEPAPKTSISFKGKFPAEFLVSPPPNELVAWHLVGGLDLLDQSDLTGDEPDDGYPVLLTDWIKTDGLKCLKVKLRGTDQSWDLQRLVRVGQIARRAGVLWLSADFNCTVSDPAYVNGVLDQLRDDQPEIYGMILYVEQPFPYELEQHLIDVHAVSARKPLFLDESAHDWRMIRLGRELGWTGVALKTCKTQTGALLSACWAKAHGMSLMVQDLSNPMLAQIPHVLLAAHVGTVMGVETNAMQFYPEASKAEAKVHPDLYRRRNGVISLATLDHSGLCYQIEKIKRELPPPAAQFGG